MLFIYSILKYTQQARSLVIMVALVLRQPLMVPILIQLLLVVEPGPGKVTPDGVDHEEQESKHQQPQHNIYCYLPTLFKASVTLGHSNFLIIKYYSNHILFDFIDSGHTRIMSAQTANNKRKVDHNSAKKNGSQLNGDQQINKEDQHKHVLTEAETYIKNILTNSLLYQESALDQTIFQSSLVIKLEVPHETYKKRSSRMQLGSIVRKFPSSFYKAYQGAYDQLFTDMQEKGDDVERKDNNDKELLIRRFCSFVPLDKYQVLQNGFQNYSQTNSDVSHPIKFHNVKRVFSAEGEEEINLNCLDQATGYLDEFIITYNTLIYSLQQFCGFKVRSFLVSRKKQGNTEIKKQKVKQELKRIQELNDGVKRTVYILLYLPNALLLKAANKYHIKKQIDYAQIDPFLNDPMDSANRPIRYNTMVRNYLTLLSKKREEDKFKPRADEENKQTGKKNREDENNDDLKMTDELAMKLTLQILKSAGGQQKEEGSKRKTMDRKVGLLSSDHMKGTIIVNEVKLSNHQVEKYGRFNIELQEELQKLIGLEENKNYFNDPTNEDKLTEQQKKYLFLINRGKFNLGVEKAYVQLKKKRKYFTLLHDIAEKHGYKVYDSPLLYAEFQIASKQMKFFSRLEQMLLYKQSIVSPYGELALFNKMQKIKLAYLVLKQHIRVENLYMLNSNIYALPDEYEKFNKIGKRNSDKFYYHYEDPNMYKVPTIQGGLDGHNLAADWKQLLVWRTDFKTIRNYLGQTKAFQILIKTMLIQMFMFLIPIGILFQVIKDTVISPNSSQAAYLPEFWFYMVYMFCIVIVYGIFVERYRRAETNYIRNFIEFNPNVDFISEYRGPYKRDKLNDNANTYDQKYMPWKDRLKTYLSFSIIIIFLGVEIGLYYAMRAAIVEVSYKVPNQIIEGIKYLKPIHIAFYSIFFFETAAFYNFFLVGFARWVTNFENRPTREAFLKSENLKLYIFAIGVEMIAPIDLVFIQAAAKTSCSSNFCAFELEDYIKARYLIILFFAILSTINMVRKLIRRKKLGLPKIGKAEEDLTYSRKLALFLQFAYEESLKEPCSDIKLIDETVALVQFSTYLTGLPIGALISFIAMMADYNIERQSILSNQQRPIPKSEGFQTYRKIIVAIGHWMLFFNFSQMFISLEWLQYLFPGVVLALSSEPSVTSITTIKYITIVLFMLLYEIIMAITVRLTRLSHSFLDARKWNMFSKHSLKILNLGENIQLKKPEPLHSISRTFNLQKKGENQSSIENMGTTSELNIADSANKSRVKKK